MHAQTYHHAAPIRTFVSSIARDPLTFGSHSGKRSRHRRYHLRTPLCDRRLRRRRPAFRKESRPGRPGPPGPSPARSYVASGKA